MCCKSRRQEKRKQCRINVQALEAVPSETKSKVADRKFCEMNTRRRLNRIEQGITELQTALFRDFSPSVIKFPNSIIRIGDISDQGNIIFSVSRPFKNLSGVEPRFAAELRFYNKLYAYMITLTGTASIVDQNELSDVETAPPGINDPVYICLHATAVTYCVFPKKKTSVWSANLSELIKLLYDGELAQHPRCFLIH